MAQRIIIDGLPITADESADEQQEGRLRLMEIGDELIYDMKLIAGLDHDLGLGMECVLTGCIEVVEDGLQSISRKSCIYSLVGFKLSTLGE